MIKTLIKSIREYKKETILTPVFVTIEVILEVFIPLMMANLIDNGLYDGNMDVIYKVGVQLILVTLLTLLFGVLAGVFSSKASSGFAKNLRKDMYYNVQNFSFSNIDKFSTSSIITRLTTDVTNVQNSFQMIIRMVVRAPLMMVFSVIMVLTINAKLSIIFLCIAPFLGLGLYFIMSKAYPIFRRVFKRYDELNRVVEENVSGIRVVKSYVLEEEEKRKFQKVSKDIFKDFSGAEKIIALTGPLMQMAIYISILLISWFGAKIIVNTGMTEFSTGELISLITYAGLVLHSLLMIGMVIVMIAISRASAERIVEILKEKSDLKNPKKPHYEVKDGSIKFKNVSFSYVKDKDKEVLKNINLEIGDGQTIGIIGGTGTGKTSLINLIPRLYDVTEGIVEVGGLNVKDYDLQTLRDEAIIVLQKNVLFSGTIKENLRWGNLDATDEEIERVCKLAQADDFIKNFPDGYDTYIEQGGTNVSGGQKQRLCIARALLKKPKILILDDSTSAVDTKTDSFIRKAFKEEMPNTTKIIIAQRILSIEDADKIIVMNNGKIDGYGTHKELLKNNEIYKEVYESQLNGGTINE